MRARQVLWGVRWILIVNPVRASEYLTLIPYYTWANRGPSKMSVWLPVDY